MKHLDLINQYGGMGISWDMIMGYQPSNLGLWDLHGFTACHGQSANWTWALGKWILHDYVSLLDGVETGGI